MHTHTSTHMALQRTTYTRTNTHIHTHTHVQGEEEEPVKGKPTRTNYEAPPRPEQRHDTRNDPRYHDEDQTPRVQRAAPLAVKQSPYYGLQDAPSPSGRLSDRIERLKQR